MLILVVVTAVAVVIVAKTVLLIMMVNDVYDNGDEIVIVKIIAKYLMKLTMFIK